MTATHYPDGWCDCHCSRCGRALERYIDTLHFSCGDCLGGGDIDGEAFRGGEAAAFEAERMAAWQRERRS